MRNAKGRKICQLCKQEKGLGLEAVCAECKPKFLRRAGCAFIVAAETPSDDVQIIEVEETPERAGAYVQIFLRDRLIGTWHPAPLEPAGPEDAAGNESP